MKKIDKVSLLFDYEDIKVKRRDNMAKASKSEASVETLRFLMVTRGIVAVLFGIMALVWPGLTVLTFATLITLWLLVSGVINIVRGVLTIGDGYGWIFTLIVAALQIGVGAYLIQRPALTIATLIALVAIAFVVEGVVSIIVPFFEGREVKDSHKVLTVVFGIIAVIAGVSIWRYPVTGGLAFVWVVGLYALITGPMWIAMGLTTKE